MPRYRVRSNWKGFAHPKKKKIKSKPSKALPEDQKEAPLQEFANSLFRDTGQYNIRIPDALNTWVVMNAPPHIRQMWSDAVKGLPDNVVIDSLKPEWGIGMCFLPELKSASGRLSPEQRATSEEIGSKLFKDRDTLKRYFEVFKKVVAHLSKTTHEWRLEHEK